MATAAVANEPPPQRPFTPGWLGPLRALWFAATVLPWTLFWFVVGLPLILTHRRTGGDAQITARCWGRGLLLLNGMRIRVHGRERFARGTPRMIVANHTSFLDPPLLAAVVPGRTRFLLKKELLRFPFIGWYARMARHFLIDRGDPRQAKALQDRAVQQVRERHQVPIVFPEGTRSADGRLAPLKAGAFDLALKAGIDVQPIWIEGTFVRMPRDARYPRRGGTLVVKVGEPIPIAGFAGGPGRRALVEQVEAAMHAMARDAR